MWKDEGWRGFMRGNGTNCIRIFPYSAVQFSAYTILKANIIALNPGVQEEKDETKLLNAPASKILTSMDNIGGRSLTTIERLSAGCLAGTASVLSHILSTLSELDYPFKPRLSEIYKNISINWARSLQESFRSENK